jgi:hypothetical protein
MFSFIEKLWERFHSAHDLFCFNNENELGYSVVPHTWKMRKALGLGICHDFL